MDPTQSFEQKKHRIQTTSEYRRPAVLVQQQHSGGQFEKRVAQRKGVAMEYKEISPKNPTFSHVALFETFDLKMLRPGNQSA